MEIRLWLAWQWARRSYSKSPRNTCDKIWRHFEQYYLMRWQILNNKIENDNEKKNEQVIGDGQWLYNLKRDEIEPLNSWTLLKSEVITAKNGADRGQDTSLAYLELYELSFALRHWLAPDYQMTNNHRRNGPVNTGTHFLVLGDFVVIPSRI